MRSQQKSTYSAWEDTKDWLLNHIIAWFLAFLLPGGGTVLATYFIPPTMDIKLVALYGFIGGIAGLLLLVIGTYGVQCILIIKKQRDDARSEILKLKENYEKLEQSIEKQKQDKYVVGNFSKLNDKGIEKTIREWLDKPSFTIKRREVPDTYFQFDVDDQYARKLSIRRDKKNPSLIQLLTYMVFEPDNIAKMKPKHTQIASKLSLELSRLGINYNFDERLEKLNIYDVLPLDDSLNEPRFIERIGLVIRALIISKAAILEVLPELGINPSVSYKEGSQS
jgi:hypothetical protein